MAIEGAGFGSAARAVAGFIALAALAGIVLYADAQIQKNGSLPGTVWVLVRYFTILCNFLVLGIFGAIALGVRIAPRWIAGTTLAIVLVGVIYELLLHGLVELTAGSAIANTLLHRLTPLAVPVFWLLFVPKGTLHWTDPLLWAAFPVAYLAYALVRGTAEGTYAYPFLDLGKLGATQVAITVVVIGIGFLVAGELLVGLDRWLSARRP